MSYNSVSYRAQNPDWTCTSTQTLNSVSVKWTVINIFVGYNAGAAILNWMDLKVELM